MQKLNSCFPAILVIMISGILSGISISAAEQNLIKIKCTKCHSEKVPDNYTRAEWKYNVERMAQRAGLTDKEIQTIIDLNKRK